MWATLTLMTALSVAPGQEGLQLTNDRVTYGILGPTRTDKKFLPGDMYFLSYDIVGLTAKNGLMQYSMKMELLDGKGKPKFSSNVDEREVFDILGGGPVPGFAHAVIGLDSEPGEYSLKLTVVDLPSKKSQTLTRTFEVGAREFGLVGVQLTYDGTLPAPPFLVVGQPLLLKSGIVGFDRDPKTRQPRVALELRILDEGGRPTQPKPIADEINKNVDEKTSLLTAPVDFAMLRAGKYTIEMKATDLLNKKSSAVTLPVTVVEVPK